MRRRDLPQIRRYDVEDNARQRHPGRDPVLPQHYPDQVARPDASYSCVHVRPEFFDGEGDLDQYISHFQNCADLGRWSETDKALTLSACLMGQVRAFILDSALWIAVLTKDWCRNSVSVLAACDNRAAT